MTAEQQGSDESGEGLTARIYAQRDQLPTRLHDPHAAFTRDDAANIARAILASDWLRQHTEAALATARRDADEMRDRLAAVEALLRLGSKSRGYWQREDGHGSVAGIREDHLRAALANPSAAQGEREVVCDHDGIDHDVRWSCWPCPACGVCKFIGHGPLCIDCCVARATGEGEVPR